MITMIDNKEMTYRICEISKELWEITGDGCDFVSPAQMTYSWIVPMIIEMYEGLKEEIE